MTNTTTYYLHYDIDGKGKVVIQNESFDDMLISIMKKPFELKLTMIDRFGIANSKLDDIINEFIKDYRQKGHHSFPFKSNDGFKSFPDIFKKFVNGLIDSMHNPYSGDFDVLNRTAKISFRVDIPGEYVTQEKREEFKALGPDYLIAQSYPEVVYYESILPAFYLALYKIDRLSDKTDATDLIKYEIGLR